MSTFQPVATEKITDLIIEQIREAILSGDVKPLERLPSERELVTRFKASRIAVREALKSLEAAGLLVIKPGSGVFVAEADSRIMSESLYSILRIQNISISEITEARLIFEPHVARLAATRITEKDIELLEENIGKTEAVLESGAPATAENVEFHALVAGCVHNTVIELTMKTMLDVAREMTINRSSDSLQARIAISREALVCHRNMVKALKKKDSRKSRRLMLNHIVKIQNDLKNALAGE
jgi:GntR family transcriptional repressor for pyruvate dehydrogenase complex